VALVVVLTLLAIVTRESIPPVVSIGWATAAGACGSLGIAALYKGLATERSSHVMPAAGVVGAAFPVLFGAVFEGFLPALPQAGLVVALGGIWLVSEGQLKRVTTEARGLLIGTMAGIGFGSFFILLGQVESEQVFAPLAVTAYAGLGASLVVMVVAREPIPSLARNPLGYLTGILDATGVVFYMLAIRWIRLDVAAVLGSLYPAVAVLLFWRFMRERVSPMQWVGIAVCVAAIGLIAA
jgi:drug/metabolite transporter (DMT)-like permease